MFKNLYEAPQELATGGYVTRELHSVTVHFDDIHYSLSSGQLNGGYHHTLAVRNQQLTYRNRKRFTRWLCSRLFGSRI